MSEDLFDDKSIEAMLIGREEPAFNSHDYIYELKFDGVRCLAYFDKGYMDLRNKRHLSLLAKFPELQSLHTQVKKKCILDGELHVFKDGKNDFFAMQKRCLTSNPFKIRLASKDSPATYTVFDILYYDGLDVRKYPLMKRKKILDKVIKENERMSVSRIIEEKGIELFQLTSEQDLEGIVAKKKTSIYRAGRSKDWIKSKNMMDEDFVIVGYIMKAQGMISLILANYQEEKLVYKGHVTLGVNLAYIQKHTTATHQIPFREVPKGNEEAIWITPFVVGTVKFMEYTQSKGMRQPVFKGFREDKLARECMEK